MAEPCEFATKGASLLKRDENLETGIDCRAAPRERCENMFESRQSYPPASQWVLPDKVLAARGLGLERLTLLRRSIKVRESQKRA